MRSDIVYYESETVRNCSYCNDRVCNWIKMARYSDGMYDIICLKCCKIIKKILKELK